MLSKLCVVKGLKPHNYSDGLKKILYFINTLIKVPKIAKNLFIISEYLKLTYCPVKKTSDDVFTC